jgi:hypothetical protein
MAARGGHIAIGLALALLLSAGVAQAQRPTADHFRPAATTSGILTLPGATTPGHMRGSLGATVDYAWAPLQEPAPGDDASLIDHRLSAHIGGQLGLGRRGVLALDLPVVLAQAGGVVGAPGAGVAAAAPGDLALEGRVRLAGALPRSASAPPVGFGLAAALGATVPTGVQSDFAGEGQLTAFADLHLDYLFAPGFGVSASVGYLLRPYDRQVGNARLDDVVRYALGAKVPLPPAPSLSLRLETRGELGRDGPGSHHFALDAGAMWSVNDDFSLVATVGTGLGHGYATPHLRGVAGLIWQPRSRDADGDGVPDEADGCPQLPEDFDGFEDADGCDDVDNDQDFVLDTEDACPNDAADPARDADMNGCTDA